MEEDELTKLLKSFDKYNYEERKLTSEESNEFVNRLNELRPSFSIHAVAAIKRFLKYSNPSSTIRNAVLTKVVDMLSLNPQELRCQDESRCCENEEDYLLSITTRRSDFLKSTLLYHLADINANVRSKVMLLLAELVKKKKLSIPEMTQVLVKAVTRLQDESLNVRKNAVVLLGEIMTANPLSIKFTPKEFDMTIKEVKENLMTFYRKGISDKSILIKKVVQRFHRFWNSGYADICLKKFESGELKHTELIEDLLAKEMYWDACELHYTSSTIQKDSPREAPSAIATYFCGLLDTQVEDVELNLFELNGKFDSDKLEHMWQNLEYFLGWERISEVLKISMNKLTSIFKFGKSSELIQVARLFSNLSESGVYKSEEPEALENFVRAIEIVAKEDGKRDQELLAIFQKIYFPLESHNNELKMVKRLLWLVKTVTARETLELIVERLYQANFIPKGAVEKLWDAYALKNEMWSDEDSNNALLPLSVICRNKKANVLISVQKLVRFGLGERRLLDFDFVKNVLKAILRVCIGLGNDEPVQNIRFPSSNILFEEVMNFLNLSWISLRTESQESQRAQFPQVLGLCVQIFYKLSLTPEDNVTKILDLASRICQDTKEKNEHLQEWHLIWYLSLMTAILGGHGKYLKNTVITELRRRKKLIEEYSKRKSLKLQSGRSVHHSSRNISAPLDRSRSSSPLDDVSRSSSTSSDMQAMLGTLGHEPEVEKVKAVLESLMDQGTFKCFRTETLNVCNQIKEHKTLMLTICGVKALLKIMNYSRPSQVRSDVMILNRIWDESDGRLSIVKITIAMDSSPLFVKFPNEMEGFKDCLITGLKNPDSKVRMACLDIIIYLSLGGFIKILDVLSPCAIRLCDESLEIQEMAKDFFKQIAIKKENHLTNAASDIIQNVCNQLAKGKLSRQDSQQILEFILKIIGGKQGRQLPVLVYRITKKFKTTDLGRSALSFSISLLPHNEKTISIMIENFSCFADKLDNEVYGHFVSVIETLRESASGDLICKLDEFQVKLEESRGKWLQFRRIESDKRRECRNVLEMETDSCPDLEASLLSSSNHSKSSDEGSFDMGQTSGHFVKRRRIESDSDSS